MHNRAVQPAKEERDRRQIRQTREYSGRGEDYCTRGRRKTGVYTIHIGQTEGKTYRQTGRYT